MDLTYSTIIIQTSCFGLIFLVGCRKNNILKNSIKYISWTTSHPHKTKLHFHSNSDTVEVTWNHLLNQPPLSEVQRLSRIRIRVHKLSWRWRMIILLSSRPCTIFVDKYLEIHTFCIHWHSFMFLCCCIAMCNWEHCGKIVINYHVIIASFQLSNMDCIHEKKKTEKNNQRS